MLQVFSNAQLQTAKGDGAKRAKEKISFSAPQASQTGRGPPEEQHWGNGTTNPPVPTWPVGKWRRSVCLSYTMSQRGLPALFFGIWSVKLLDPYCFFIFVVLSWFLSSQNVCAAKPTRPKNTTIDRWVANYTHCLGTKMKHTDLKVAL